jgi:hypothetical protein
MSESAPKIVVHAAELNAIGRLFLECCVTASVARNAPIEDTAKMRIARSLIRHSDRYWQNPEKMKRLALKELRVEQPSTRNVPRRVVA